MARSTKKILKPKPKPKTIVKKETSPQKTTPSPKTTPERILTAEGWKRLMMKRSKKSR